MRSLKINRLLPIYISIVPLKFGVYIQSQTKVSPETKKSNMATRQPFWKWRQCKSIGFCLWSPSTRIWSLKLKFQSKLDLHAGNHATYRVQKRKIQNGRLAAILKMTLLKINRLLLCPWSLKLIFKAEVKLESGNQKKKTIWPPGGHFESDVAENQ